MTEPVSLEQLGAAARRYDDAIAESTAAHDELVRLVRVATSNGIPKARIATVIGRSGETVRKYAQR